MINPSPECSRQECKFLIYPGSSFVAYYPPYDKNGVKTNPDRNATTSMLECLTCGKKWEGKTRLGKITYEEVK